MRTKHVALRPPRPKSQLKSDFKSEEAISISSESAGDDADNMASSPLHKDRKRKSVTPSTSASQQQRVWSDEAAEALLRGMMEFRTKTGSIPSTAIMADFFDFVKSSLPPELTKDQVYNKIRHLRDRYTTGRTGVHSSVIQQLASEIWGAADEKKDETNDGELRDGGGSGDGEGDLKVGVQLNNGDGNRGGEENGGWDVEANIISNSPKSTPKKKSKTLVAEEENHRNAAKPSPKKKKKKAAKEEEGHEVNDEQIPAEKVDSSKKEKKMNKAPEKANFSYEKEVPESVLCNNYPCLRDAIKEVCRFGGFGSSLMAELLGRIKDEKLEAMEKKYESHWATEMKLRAQLMELNAELHRLLLSAVNNINN